MTLVSPVSRSSLHLEYLDLRSTAVTLDGAHDCSTLDMRRADPRLAVVARNQEDLVEANTVSNGPVEKFDAN